MSITVQEDFSPEYVNRTEVNASQADVTIAIAIDFNSKGERLTRKLADKHHRSYVPIDPLGDVEAQAATVVETINAIQPKYRGAIKMSDTHTESVIAGRKRLTSRTESYHALFYKGDGIYQNADFDFKRDRPATYANTLFFVQLLGKKHVDDFTPKQLEVLAQREGFRDLADMTAGCRPETASWLRGENHKYFYNICIADGREIVLNIAGNGIYTMKGVLNQAQCDNFTERLLEAIVHHPNLQRRIGSVRTGGQTGFDEAGAKAALALHIPTSVLMPKGYRIRTMEGDITMDYKNAVARFVKH